MGSIPNVFLSLLFFSQGPVMVACTSGSVPVASPACSTWAGWPSAGWPPRSRWRRWPSPSPSVTSCSTKSSEPLTRLPRHPSPDPWTPPPHSHTHTGSAPLLEAERKFSPTEELAKGQNQEPGREQEWDPHPNPGPHPRVLVHLYIFIFVRLSESRAPSLPMRSTFFVVCWGSPSSLSPQQLISVLTFQVLLSASCLPTPCDSNLPSFALNTESVPSGAQPCRSSRRLLSPSPSQSIIYFWSEGDGIFLIGHGGQKGWFCVLIFFLYLFSFSPPRHAD